MPTDFRTVLLAGAWDVQFTADELAEIRGRLPQETVGERY